MLVQLFDTNENPHVFDTKTVINASPECIHDDGSIQYSVIFLRDASGYAKTEITFKDKIQAKLQLQQLLLPC